MIIYLMRHGQTDYNKNGLIQGNINIALNDYGKKQALIAKEVVDKLGIEVVYTGNLDRQIATAKLVTDNVSHVVLDNFTEISFGEFEGVNVNEVFPLVNKRLGINLKGFSIDSAREICDAFYKADKTGKAESFEMMAKRFNEGIKKVEEDALKNNINKVLIVSSGMAIGSIISYLCPNFAYYSLKNCSIHSLELLDDGSYKTNLIFEGVNKQ